MPAMEALAVLGGGLSRTDRWDHLWTSRTNHAGRSARAAAVGGPGLRRSARPAGLSDARAVHGGDALPAAGAHRGQGPPHHGRGEGPPQGGALRLGRPGRPAGVLPPAAGRRVRRTHLPGQDHRRQHDRRHGVPLGGAAGVPRARRGELPLRGRPHQRPLRGDRGALHRGPPEAGGGPPGRARRRVRGRLLDGLRAQGVRRPRGGRGRGGGHRAPRVREERQEAHGALERHRPDPPQAAGGLLGLRQAHLPAVRVPHRTRRRPRARRRLADRGRLGPHLAGRVRRVEPLPAQAAPARDGPRPVPGEVQDVPEPRGQPAAGVCDRAQRPGRVPRRQRRPALFRGVAGRQDPRRAQGGGVLRPQRVRHQRRARRLLARHPLPALDRVQDSMKTRLLVLLLLLLDQL